MSSSITYRPDIDGLRALAILSVLIFHISPSFLSGGFIGVDIFFVISGYLITSIILNDLQTEKFSIGLFYSKRVLRLYPNLIVTLFVTFVLGFIWLLPSEFSQLGKHMACGVGFVSNICFNNEAGYFDNSSDTKPLQHLWSLGVEEQFYLIWPFLMFLIYRFKKNALPYIVAATSVFLFFVGLNKVNRSPEAAFYLPQMRFWEILAGALIPLFQNKMPSYRPRWLVELASAIGLACCLIPFFLLSEKSIFPGWWALLPVSGAFLIITLGRDSLINRHLLSSRVMVWFGLISYPLYLWHWPLLSYSSILYNDEAPTTVRILLALSAIVLAYLSYRLVEIPIRKHANKSHSKTVTSLVVGSLLVGVIGIAAYYQRLNPLSSFLGFKTIDNAVADWSFPGKMKRFQLGEGGPGAAYYTVGIGDKSLVFIGDSNMQQYYQRIEKLNAQNPQYTSMIFAGGGCVPILGVDQSLAKYRHCKSTIEAGWKEALKPTTQAVVISAQWTTYFSLNARSNTILVKGKKFPLEFGTPGFEEVIGRLREGLDLLKRNGKRVYLVLNIPVSPLMAPKASLERSLSLNPLKQASGTIDRQQFEAANPGLGVLKMTAERAAVTTINPLDYLCEGTPATCSSIDINGEPIYMNGSHLRDHFALRLEYLDQVFKAQD
jgi:peptidoglycan/LPS O-acetylase OafA/YrhL